MVGCENSAISIFNREYPDNGADTSKVTINDYLNKKLYKWQTPDFKRNTSNWSKFCRLLLRADLSASDGLSCCCCMQPENKITIVVILSLITTNLIDRLIDKTSAVNIRHDDY